MERGGKLGKKVVLRFVVLMPLLAGVVILPAWTPRYWQGWAFLIVFLTANALTFVYLLRKDPELLERRIRSGARAEKEKSQKIIVSFARVFFFPVLAFPGFDHRFGWSHLPVWSVVAGDALVVVGLLIVFFTLRANSYASSVIEVDKDQSVVSTGPYRFVRHPMYAGMIVMILGVPLGLGSAWGLLLCIPFIATLLLRLIDEESYLVKNLAGYEEYRAKTRSRLIPGIY